MNDIGQRIEQYKADRRHGASQLQAVALEILMDATRQLPADHARTIIARLDSLAREMADARPGMANINNIMNWYRKSLSLLDASADKETVRKNALKKAGLMCRYCLEASRLLTVNAVRSIADASTVMTCSFSSTVLRTLKEAYRAGTRFSILVLESCWQDCCYGAFMHRELMESGVESRLIKDAEAAKYLPGTDQVLLGADTLFPDGTLINGFPSRELAAAAVACRPAVPVIALLESFKISGQPETGKPPDGFQAIPFDCLAGVITEKGLHQKLGEIQALSGSSGPEEFI
jgi:translation initiation factor 2B subunit (eIF-2B alpha/beta/delta family)